MVNLTNIQVLDCDYITTCHIIIIMLSMTTADNITKSLNDASGIQITNFCRCHREQYRNIPACQKVKYPTCGGKSYNDGHCDCCRLVHHQFVILLPESYQFLE